MEMRSFRAAEPSLRRRRVFDDDRHPGEHIRVAYDLSSGLSSSPQSGSTVRIKAVSLDQRPLSLSLSLSLSLQLLPRLQLRP